MASRPAPLCSARGSARASALATLATLLLAAPGALHADKRLRAAAIAHAPVIDGALDDAAWQSAHFTSDFAQKQPTEGATPSRRTEVAILYDGEALYVGARMHAPGPHDIEAVMTRHDDTGAAERIIISLDTFRDRRTAYSFAVTAAGVRADWYHPDDEEFQRDRSFAPVWTARTSIGPHGWTAEMRIPFTQLRFGRGARQDWGININRYVPQYNEDIYWIVVPKDEVGWASRMGALEGIEGIAQPLRLEVVPFVAGDVTVTSSGLVAGNPLADTLDAGANAGVDVKMGLGPGLTLDATINPDFGQVEADPAQVNLTAYETLFAENRPFFTEGANLLAGQGPSYYYSRRIGGAPHLEAEADHVDAPSAARILGAGKLTGRLPSGTSIGALAALTQRTHARTYDLATGARDRVAIEPLTSYGVLRAQQELGASVVGTSLTGVHRALDPGEPLAAVLARQAVTGGADWNLRFAGGAYELDGHAGFSHIRGEPAAMAAIARSSVHYFQRPDQQGHLPFDPGTDDAPLVDPDRGSLSGATAALKLARRTGAWLWDLGTWLETPGFDVNDTGILLSADDISTTGRLRYRSNVPRGPVHSWEAGTVAISQWNFGGERAPGLSETFSRIVWKRFWSTTVAAQVLWPGVSDDATRGGPLTGIGWGGLGLLRLESPPASRTRWNAEIVYDVHQTGRTGIDVRGEIGVRPLDRLGLSLAPRYTRSTNNRQYVATVAGDNAATYGSRYVFGTLDYRELALQARAQLAFTPRLALDLYLEPFAARGRYRALGELHAPRRRGLDIYGEELGTIARGGDGYTVAVGGEQFALDDPDFTSLSLRSTLVLRWELLPGSTLFLVWQQNRNDERGEAGALTPASLGRAFTSPGSHALVAKLAYWWPAG